MFENAAFLHSNLVKKILINNSVNWVFVNSKRLSQFNYNEISGFYLNILTNKLVIEITIDNAEIPNDSAAPKLVALAFVLLGST